MAGYYGASQLVINETIETPSLIGQNVTQAVLMLSPRNIHLRIIAKKEDADMPDGTILAQHPGQGHTIKAHQSINIVVSQQPLKLRAPRLIGLQEADVYKQGQKIPLRIKTYFLEHTAPSGCCIAQWPEPDTELDEPIVTVYISSGITSLRVFPQLKEQVLSDVIEFLEAYHIKAQIFADISPLDSSLYGRYIIHDQKPLAGSYINLTNPPLVQLSVIKVPTV